MADTIRTLDELNIILRDNGANELSAQDIRDLVVSMMVHGEIGAINNAEITLGASWQTVDLDTAGVIKRGVTLDVATHQIKEIAVDLKAQVAADVCFLGAAGQVYDFAVYKNGSTQIGGSARTLHGAGATPVSYSWSVSAQLLQDETLELAVRSNGNVFTLKNGLLRIKRIGVE